MSSALTINTNLASQNAQRRLSESTGTIQKSFERLSSGLRINRAADDAAGLAVSSSLNVDARVLTQGTRNANDAISYFSIAEGSVSSLVNITIRLKELAEQSANGVLTGSQRRALDAEAQALGKEYSRIIQTTQFNGQNIINGNEAPLSIQVGYDALLLSGGKAASGSFQTPLLSGTPNSPYAVASSDLNADGNLDLVTANTFSDSVSVLLGNGDGSFKISNYSTGDGPKDIILFDANGDGILDMATADGNANRVSVFLGNGNGTFGPRISLVTGTGPNSIIASDVNGDGRMDLISSDYGSSQVSVFLGAGGGTFQARRSYSTPLASVSVNIADVNGDGIGDLLAADNAFGVLLGNTDGSFKAGTNYGTSLGNYVVVPRDLNGDGNLDVISADLNLNRISIFFGNGNGSFQSPLAYATGSRPTSVVVEDFNSDGILDIISSDRDSDIVSVFLGNGGGTFQSRQSYAAGAKPYDLITGDVNGDGIQDLITASYYGPGVGVLLGNGTTRGVVAPTTGSYSLLTMQDSLLALTQFGKVLNGLTASLGQIGANQSRLITVTNILNINRENYLSAASQILDVDVAQESASLVRNNILIQAGAAILSQANQQPSLALQLLGGI